MAVNSLQDVRDQYPEFADSSDEELLDRYASDVGLPSELVRAGLMRGPTAAPVADVDPNEGVGDLRRALRTYGNQLTGLGSATVGLAADAVGAEGLRDRMFASYQEDMADIQALHKDAYELQHLTSDEATAGDYVDAAQYYATLGLANLAGGGLAGLAGKQLAKTGVKKLAGEVTEQTMKKAATRGFYGGIGASAIAQEVGATYGQAVEEQLRLGNTIDDVNKTKAALFGVAAGSVEFASDLFLLGAAKMLPAGAATKFAKAGEALRSGGKVARGVKGFGAAGVVEAGTEVAQTLLEDVGSEVEVQVWDDDTAAQVDYRNKLWQAAFAGAAAGGTAGGIMGVVRGDSRQQNRDDPTDLPPVDPDQDPNLPTEEEVQRVIDTAPDRGNGLRDALLTKIGVHHGYLREPSNTAEGIDVATGAFGSDVMDMIANEKDGKKLRKERQSALDDAFNEKSGVWVNDPESQREVELSMGELWEMHAINRYNMRNTEAPVKPTLPILKSTFNQIERAVNQALTPVEEAGPYVRVADTEGNVSRQSIDLNSPEFAELVSAAAATMQRRASRPAQQIENIIDEPDSITPPDTVEKAEQATRDALARAAKVKDPKPKKTTPTINRTDPIFQTEAGRTALNENATESGQPNRTLQVLLENYRKRDSASLQKTIRNSQTAPWKKALAAEVVAERGGNVTAAVQATNQPVTQPTEPTTVQEAVPVTNEQALQVAEGVDQISGLTELQQQVWEFVRDAALNDEMESIVSRSGKNTTTLLSPKEITARLFPGLTKTEQRSKQKRVSEALKGLQSAIRRDMNVDVHDALAQLNTMRRQVQEQEAAILQGEVIDETEIAGEVADEQALANQDEEVDAVAQEELSEGAGLTIRREDKGAFGLGFLDQDDQKRVDQMLKMPEVDEIVGAEYEAQTGQTNWGELKPSQKRSWFAKFEQAADAVQEEAAAQEQAQREAEQQQAEHQELLELFTGKYGPAIQIYDSLAADQLDEAARVPFADLQSGYQETVIAAVLKARPTPKGFRDALDGAVKEISNARRQEAADARTARLGRDESAQRIDEGQVQDETVDAGVSQTEAQQAVKGRAEQLAAEGKIKTKRKRVPMQGKDGTPMRAVEFAGKPENGLTRAKALIAANRIIKSRGWRNVNAPLDLKVVASYADLPQDIREQFTDDTGTWMAGVQITSDDTEVPTVYLIADMHANEVELESTLLHEMLHAAASTYFGDRRFSDTAAIALGMGRDNLMELADKFGVKEPLLAYEQDFAQIGYTYAAAQGVLFEEMMAYTVGNGNDRGIVNRIKAAIGEFRQWLRRMGFLRTSEIGETETLALIRRLYKTMEDANSIEYGFWTSDTGEAALDNAIALEYKQLVPLNAVATEGGQSIVDELVAGRPMDSYVDEVIGIMDAAVASGRYESYTDDAGRLSIRPVAENWKDNLPTALGGSVTSLAEYRKHRAWVDMKPNMEVQIIDPSTVEMLEMQLGKGLRMVLAGPISDYSAAVKVKIYDGDTAVGELGIGLSDLRAMDGRQIRYNPNGNLPNPLAAGVIRQKQQTTSMLGALTDKIAKSAEQYVPGLVNLYNKGVLGLMTLEQINNFGKRLGLSEVSNYVDAVHAVQRTSKDYLADAHIMNTRWSKLRSQKPAQVDKLHTLMLDTTLAEYDPSVDTAATDEQKKLKRTFDALDRDVRDLYTSVRDQYATWHQDKVEVLEQAILDAEAAGNVPQLEKVRANLESMKKLKGPYFPLKRLDQYYAVAISSELKQLMDKNDEAPLTGKDKTLMAQMRKDPEHYRVESFKTLKDARDRSAEMKTTFGNSYYQESVDMFKPETTDIPNLATIESYFVSSDLDDNAKAKIRSILQYMYADMLPANSAAKSQMKREGIAGAEQDMQRVFSDSAVKNAHQISRLKHAKDVNQSLLDVRMMGRRQDQGDVTRIRNEVLARANLVYEHENSPITDAIMTGSFFTYLGLSPAYVLTNFSQVGMITVPWLAGRHSPNTVLRQVGKAYKDAGKIIYSNYAKNGWRTEFDWKGKVTDGESAMLEELLQRNKLDVTIEHDLTATAEGSSPWTFNRSNDYIQIANLPVRITELNNRAVTALAAYRLELARLAKDRSLSAEQRQAKATAYAVDAVNETQLDYSGLNSARYMQKFIGSRDIARVMFQFRKYQQGMVYLVMNNIFDGFTRAGVSKERQREAQRTLFGLFTTTGLVGGLAATPLAGTIAAIAEIAVDVFGEDDEPFDAELALREYIATMFGGGPEGAEVARMVMKGIPTQIGEGVDVSRRITMGDLLFPFPFMRDGSTPRETMSEMVIAAMGAAPNYAFNLYDGGKILQEAYAEDDVDKLYKGAAKVVPIKGVQNLIKGWKLSDTGLTERSGEPILEADEFTAGEILMQALGLSPAQLSDYYTANARRAEVKSAVEDARNDLLRRYAQAKLKGNSARVQAVRKEIRDFNQRNRQRRTARITSDNLRRAVRYRQESRRNRLETGLRGGRQYESFNEDVNFITGAR